MLYIIRKKQNFFGKAKEAGCAKTIGGKGMLLWQGVAAYKLYTGLDMPVEEYKKYQAENQK